jgi:hypothetical protein
MIELFSAFLANLITQIIKGKQNRFMSQEQLDARRSIIRSLNAAVGACLTVFAAWYLGEPLEADSIAGVIETILTIATTYAASQGMYFLVAKKNV